MEKLKSRKLWVTVIVGAIVPLAAAYNIDIDPVALTTIALAVLSYNFGQGIVDKEATRYQSQETARNLENQVAVLQAQVKDLTVNENVPNTELYQG